MSDVTGLKTITNNYRSTVRFKNVETPSDNITVKPQNAGNPNGAWIPWCDNATQFPDHHMSLTSDDGVVDYVIWQSGSNIYYWSGGYSANANILYPHKGISVELSIETTGALTMNQKD